MTSGWFSATAKTTIGVRGLLSRLEWQASRQALKERSTDAVRTRSRQYKAKGASLIVTLVATTFFMENLDGTIIATALPQMARCIRRT
ncbi:MAG: Uncharacterized MFS-type transporter [uncultured Caballeronia sp.]|nr:MAG: Uncharacterized MFS-type transporter [uncultured Caballeronia sp.]